MAEVGQVDSVATEVRSEEERVVWITQCSGWARRPVAVQINSGDFAMRRVAVARR